MISEELIYDERFNKLSLESQSLFMRMLAKADDCGVIPADEYALITLTNPAPKIRKNISKCLCEIVEMEMGNVFWHAGKNFFAFKRDSFDRIQSYVINKRVKSEYLNMDAETAISLISEKFLEVLGNSSENGSSPIVSNKHKEKEKEEDKAERKESTPENLEAVTALFRERGYNPKEAEKFWNYYESNGWRVGKNPMKDWKAAAANWAKNSREWNGGKPTERDPAPRMKRCEKCGKDYPSKLILCPRCYPQEQTTPPAGVMDVIEGLANKMSAK